MENANIGSYSNYTVGSITQEQIIHTRDKREQGEEKVNSKDREVN